MEKCKFIDGNERILRHTNWHVEDYEFYTEGILSWKCFTFNFHKIDDHTTFLYFNIYGMQKEVLSQMICMLFNFLNDKVGVTVSSEASANTITFSLLLCKTCEEIFDEVSALEIMEYYESSITIDDFYIWMIATFPPN